MNNDTIVVIIPSLNPSKNLITLIKQLNNDNFNNIVIVDDGSDKEHKWVFEEIKKNFNCFILKHNVNMGKGCALKTAFNYVLNRFENVIGVVTVDSDGQHQINDINNCVDLFKKNPNSIILGSRNFKEKNIPFRSKFGNTITQKIVNIFCGLNISDTQTGLRVIPTNLLKSFLLTKGERFEYEMNMLLDAKSMNIQFLEVNISTIYINNNNSSHFNPLKDSLKIYEIFLKFIISSLVSFFIDIILFSILLFILKNNNIEHYIILATIGARIFSSFINYTINKNKVFKSKNSNKKSFIKYFLLCFIQMIISAICVNLIYYFTNINESFIKIIVDTLIFIINFKIQQEFIFND